MSQVVTNKDRQSPDAAYRMHEKGIMGDYRHTTDGASLSSRQEEASTSYAHHSSNQSRSVDLDDSLRALYFAPMAIVVLDQQRDIVMLNGPAEDVLGVASAACAGQSWDQYLSPSSRSALKSALDEAAGKFAQSTARLSAPLATRLDIAALKMGRTTFDLSISAWSPNEATFTYEDTERPPARRVQDILYTIILQLSTSRSKEIAPQTSTEPYRAFDPVREFAMNSLDLPLVSVNKQGKLMDRNRASTEIWSSLLDAESSENEARRDVAKGKFDINWTESLRRLMDENFTKDLPQEDWPIYRCAIKGEKVDPVVLGIEAKLTGKRFHLEYAGHPTYSPDGQHTGGIITFRNVTKEKEEIKKQAEHQAELQFQATCDTIPVLVFQTDAVGQSEWYSQAWYDYTGASHDVSDTEAWRQYWHIDDYTNTIDTWKVAIKEEALFQTVFRIKRYDGVFRWFQGRAQPIKDSKGKLVKWYGTCTDINDHLEALSDSKRTQNQLESVIQHVNVTLWAINREGIITIAKGSGVRRGTSATSSNAPLTSPEYESSDSLGPKRKRMTIGASIYDVYSTDIQGAICKALDGENVVEETEIEGRWLRTSYTPMRAQPDEMPAFVGGGGLSSSSDCGDDADLKEGDIIGVVGASMDITDRKAAQAEMEKSLHDKSTALAAEGAAREASRLKSEFLANMSHEIRTPIAGVIGLSELILDETGLPKQLRDYVETISRSAEGLLHVINDVLDFSKVEVGKLNIEQAPFNLNTLLIDAKRMLTFATEKKGLEFKESLDLGYQGLLLGDAGRLKQVIINLLSNAIKFTSRGYISLEVMVTSEDDKTLQVCFNIRDTGSGINTEALARLFQPFSQADPSTARRFGGTGLGLSISKNLVELMGGTIGLNSDEGKGSHAWFSIRFNKAKDEDVEEGLEEDSVDLERESNATGLNDRRSSLVSRGRGDIWILIAEDNEVNARIALKNVERMGFHCRIAKDGLVALQELNSRKYDLVLMDCHMPECDGYEATRLLRKSANQSNRALPVIALTASAITGDREKALEAGMVDYLTKPVKRSALEATLCKWLFDRHARQALTKYRKPNISSRPSSKAGVESVSSPSVKKTALGHWNDQFQLAAALSGTPDSKGNLPKESQLQVILNHRLGSNRGTKFAVLSGRRFSDESVEEHTASSESRPCLSSRSQSYGAAPKSTASISSIMKTPALSTPSEDESLP
jgi:PAS domain S-box-containing protein